MPDTCLEWDDACLAAIIATSAGPAIGGIQVRARAGPVRDAWLAFFHECVGTRGNVIRIPSSTPESRLSGGLDVAATLTEGRTVCEAGVLTRSHLGFLIIGSAERLEPGSAAQIAQAMDRGSVTVEAEGVSSQMPSRFCLVALDESADEEERLPHALSDRLMLRIDLEGIPLRFASHRAIGAVQSTSLEASPEIPPDLFEQIATAHGRAGCRSLRTLIAVSRVARLTAAIEGAVSIDESILARALRLVFGNYAGAEAEPDTADVAPEEPPDKSPPDQSERAGRPADNMPDPGSVPQEFEVDSRSSAAIPLELLAMPMMERAETRCIAGKSGTMARKARRGRPCGLSTRPPYPGARPNAVATLRAAAPWQKLRTKRFRTPDENDRRLIVLPEDFRYIVRRERREATAIFAVDASGSTALERLGEAKGAVELLLSSCYVRREHVALIAFRGTVAETLLEPTRSLVRAKRSLRGLPGGGPTPLASGLLRGLELSINARRRGQTPYLILMSDGSGNISLDGAHDRAAAGENALSVARRAAGAGIRSLFIDIARRPREQARDLARAMRADYCILPVANAAAVSAVVSDRMRST